MKLVQPSQEPTPPVFFEMGAYAKWDKVLGRILSRPLINAESFEDDGILRVDVRGVPRLRLLLLFTLLAKANIWNYGYRRDLSVLETAYGQAGRDAIPSMEEVCEYEPT